MKYIVDMDAFMECLDCLASATINNERYIQKHLIKEFILRFPKDPFIEDESENSSESD